MAQDCLSVSQVARRLLLCRRARVRYANRYVQYIRAILSILLHIMAILDTAIVAHSHGILSPEDVTSINNLVYHRHPIAMHCKVIAHVSGLISGKGVPT